LHPLWRTEVTESSVVFAARVVLGAVFVASGALKVRDRAWPASARAFGAPSWSVPALPWVELAVGALVAAQFRWAALAAVVLLAAFTWLIVVHVVHGDDVPCACFGSPNASSARPVSWWHVVRNVVLAGLAVVALL
jgi:uncharacterized membrane protein YphA (DoxX/SURF4 family)